LVSSPEFEGSVLLSPASGDVALDQAAEAFTGALDAFANHPLGKPS
jgi:hypothetical protein